MATSPWQPHPLKISLTQARTYATDVLDVNDSIQLNTADIGGFAAQILSVLDTEMPAGLKPALQIQFMSESPLVATDCTVKLGPQCAQFRFLLTPSDAKKLLSSSPVACQQIDEYPRNSAEGVSIDNPLIAEQIRTLSEWKSSLLTAINLCVSDTRSVLLRLKTLANLWAQLGQPHIVHTSNEFRLSTPYPLRPPGLRVILRSHRNATRWAVFTDSALPDSRLAACAAEWRTATPALLDALDEELQRLHLLAIQQLQC